MDSRGAFFREIHKNSWLKRLTAEGKRITIGPKKSDRSWVVFCVHDDTDALLEGYTEPRSAPSHNPEWTLPLQNTQHVSHALVHNEKEFEFVITLDNGIVRFHAASWEIMTEWVEVLRQKLREMKILSPRENLYTKLPEGRIPLLPTRDPTSPLPATPPVPAAIVPGVECVTTMSININTISAPRSSSESSTNSETITCNSTNIQTAAIVHQGMSTTYRNPQLSQTIRSDPQISLNTENDITIETFSTENEVNEGISTDKKLEAESTSKFVNTQISNTENSIRVDVAGTTKSEPAGSNSFHYVVSKTKTILRPEITPSSTLSNKTTAVTNATTVNYPISNLNKTDSSNNVDKFESNSNSSNTELNCDSTNIMIIQVSNPEPTSTTANQNRSEIFKFPPPDHLTANLDNFKSNVHIIPSCLDDISQNSSPVKINSNSNLDLITQQVTTVTVSNNNNDNNNSKSQHSEDVTSSSHSSKWPEKIILSTNTSGVINISVGNETTANISIPSVHYDKVFLASSSSSSTPNTPIATNTPQQHQFKNLPSSSSSSSSSSNIKSKQGIQITKANQEMISPKSRNVTHRAITAGPSNSNSNISTTKKQNSPSVERKKPKPLERGRENVPPPLVMRRPVLTRGATEAVITTRPSRIDFMKRSGAINSSSGTTIHNTNLNSDSSSNFATTASERTRSESLDRRRSSSVSETDRRLQSNNLDMNQHQQVYHHQQQIQRLQPFRFTHENKSTNVSKKLTLREQQVMQLRREIMHPGGVRLQLRRKDCIGSIAWVDIFGAVWVSGWKQKEHPMLYNALHIGDQLISIAGSPIKTAAEANKIIRNSNTLFLEILIRRVPFGRVYAIRREIEGQCLGLIRDGNSATIVDVVPNSLSARHGLTPKAKTCDGLSLTFWVLTEINGRPLNLFCKENEVHDRLNSVGRDISILVQPLDLIMKLKKQLKSIRSFKDYIIQ